MSVSVFKIKKWFNMLSGKSVYHVCQNEGMIYSIDEIKGYYNNLTEKVTRFGMPGTEIPKIRVDTGEELYFPITIFQYGLAAYDLYLLNDDIEMLNKAIACADWAVANQQADGGWKTFDYENPQLPYSSMAQGEGISLLLRVHITTGKDIYFKCATLAKNHMLKPISDGGTAKYDGEELYLYEYCYMPLILNGWIFSIWGLFDYYKFTDDSSVKEKLDCTLSSLRKKLPIYDIKYWSKYEESGKHICSPFYHNLHISQLKVMYQLFGDEIYNEYANKWEDYTKSFWKPKLAFIKKAIQKILE